MQSLVFIFSLKGWVHSPSPSPRSEQSSAVHTAEAMEEEAVFDSNIGVDMKTIVYAVIFCGVIATTPFPHPVSKFIIRTVTILYILMMVWANLTSEGDLHKAVEWLDPSINKKIKFEAMTGEKHCALTMENVCQYDVFFLLHIFGWAAKTMMVRDFYVTTAISFMFEVIEESLEHHQPVFFECWWNRWIIDFVLCNGIAIWIGMHICTYLGIERSWWCIGNYKRKKEVSVFSLAGWNVQSLTGYLLSMIVVFSVSYIVLGTPLYYRFLLPCLVLTLFF